MKKSILLITFVIIVLYMNCPKNNPPEIADIIVTPDSVYVGDTATCRCDADDEDDDDLAYKWTVDKGTLIEDDKESVKWVAPNDTGVVNITVEVDDGKDTDDKSRTINVMADGGGVASGQNSTQYDIPYYPDFAYSPINISGEPNNAIVDSLEVTVDINHTYPTDVYVDITEPGGAWYVLWHPDSNPFPGGQQTQKVGCTGQNFPVNGEWRLYVSDLYGTGSGTLDYWEITIWYSEP